MAKKISLKLPRFKLSWQSFLGFISKLEMIGTAGVILLIFGFEYLRVGDTAGVVLAVYYVTLALIALRLIRRLLAKGEAFPTVSFDINSLMLVSMVALSLFIGIVFYQTKQNVWGGSDMRILSGVSIVALWFLFYLVASANLTKKKFSRLVGLFTIAPLIGLLLFIFNLSASISNLIEMIVVLQSGMLWIFVSQGKLKWIAFLNIIFSSIAVFFASGGAQIATIITLLFSLIVIVFAKRKELRKIFLNLLIDVKKLKGKKLSAGVVINNNSLAIFFIVGFILLAIALIAIFNNPARTAIGPSIIKGFNEIGASISIKSLLIGKGLKDIGTSSALTVVYSFGILPTIAMLALIIVIFKKLIKTAKKVGYKDDGYIWFLISALSTITAYLFVWKVVDVANLVFWMVIALVSIFSSVYVEKEEKELGIEMNAFPKTADKSTREFKQFIQKIAVIAVIMACAYVMVQVGTITKLIA